MKRTIIILAMLAVLPKILIGTEVCGNVSGVWDITGSPYYVNCDVNVPAGQALEIGPGVQVLFTGHYRFNVYGNLQAIGTEEDSIVFTRAFPTEESKGWGIRFYNADPACSLAYCVVENCHATPSNPTTGSGGGIYITQSSPAFFGCSIRNNVADYDGGGVACFDGSSPRFSESVIEHNTATGDAGGILFHTNCQPTISNCLVRYNIAHGTAGGGGLYLHQSQLFMDSTMVVGNQATQAHGGGIFSTNGSIITATQCEFDSNQAAFYGGAGYCYGELVADDCMFRFNTSGIHAGGIMLEDQSEATLTRCIIARNSSGHTGGGVFSTDGTSTLVEHCTVFGNSAVQAGGGIHFRYNSSTIHNSILWANSAPSEPQFSHTGGNPALSYSDIQGSYSGTGNIDTDPLFVNAANGDFHLQAGSPCIDAGDPASPRDPDGTVADMGAFPFTGGTPDFGFVTAVSLGPPNWEYELHWVSGSLNRLTFKPVCPGTAGSVTGAAAAAGWSANAYTDSIVFTTATPLTSGFLGGFVLSHPSCSHPLMWFAGDSSGTIDGPLPVELASFDALSLSSGIRLAFSTASETNNDFFEIMRGTSETGVFTRIAVLPSQGNSASGHHYEYLDREVTAGQTYWYYLADVDLNGNRTEHRELMRSATMTGAVELPSDYSLSAYPNPFNPTTTISFALPEAGVVRIAVFDVAGRWIQTLVNEKRGAGNHTVSFDARDLPSGVYFARMESGPFAMTKKMALIR